MQRSTSTDRSRDFWGALALVGLSIFFLWKTSTIPLFGANRAGVSGADWYNSAAIVPLGIFGAILLLSVILLSISIRSGGASEALSAVGLGWNRNEAIRFVTVTLILAGYIAGLVPRVDFILCSGLLLTALIYGYHGGHARRAVLSTGFVLAAALYAMALNLQQANWGAHDDDWVTLALWVGLTCVVLRHARRDRVSRYIPIISLVIPVTLVTAMAFGFRQNVPARTGLLFQQIEYHYYVTLRPLWRD